MIFKCFFCQVGEVKGHQELCEHTQLCNVMLSLLHSLTPFKCTSDKEKNPASGHEESPGSSRRRQGCAATDPATVGSASSETPPLLLHSSRGALPERQRPQRNHGPT